MMHHVGKFQNRCVYLQNYIWPLMSRDTISSSEACATATVAAVGESIESSDIYSTIEFPA